MSLSVVTGSSQFESIKAVLGDENLRHWPEDFFSRLELVKVQILETFLESQEWKILEDLAGELVSHYSQKAVASATAVRATMGIRDAIRTMSSPVPAGRGSPPPPSESAQRVRPLRRAFLPPAELIRQCAAARKD